MKVCFHSNQLGERGTEVALYDFAHYNEVILGNQSVITCNNLHINNNQKVVEHFSRRFPLFPYRQFSEVDGILEKSKSDVLYVINSGESDGKESKVCKTVIHCVFDVFEPHGDVYAYISEFARDSAGASGFPVVPLMISLPKPTGNMRRELGIPDEDIVFGCIGGRHSFDIDFARQVVCEVAAEARGIWFIFMNTGFRMSPALPNVIFLDYQPDNQLKSNFIATCDAMLHARHEGEMFGIAVGEFSIQNKPVITWSGSHDRAHLQILGEKAIQYGNGEELKMILKGFYRRDGDWNAYGEYTPENVMRRFNDVFLKDTPRQTI